MRYTNISPIDRDIAIKAFNSGCSEEIADALVSLAFYDPDPNWVEERCIKFLRQENKSLQILAITCLGHIARIHHKLNLRKILPVIDALKKDAEIIAAMEDLSDDIEIYIPKRSK